MKNFLSVNANTQCTTDPGDMQITNPLASIG